ncbi:hypothetical protein Zm00014a_004281 [Zea mays]|uniref:Uncharacterized protein n=1 Tax=Zea mays TaxID=4577 RepID=A0A3L6EFM0_MAIZE|nr:hypothetical protein Zm00014a_004281 [Zea mays]
MIANKCHQIHYRIYLMLYIYLVL